MNSQNISQEVDGLMWAQWLKSSGFAARVLGNGGVATAFGGILEEALGKAIAADMPLHTLPAANGPSEGGALAPIDHWSEPRGGQRFGATRSGSRPEECGGGHCGVDLAAKKGEPVRAMAAGKVVRINSNPETAGGLTVVIRHGDRQSRYLHLDSIPEGLAVGAEVRRGEVVGAVGATGSAARGNHLHFEVLSRSEDGWRHENPMTYLKHAITPQEGPMELQVFHRSVDRYDESQ